MKKLFALLKRLWLKSPKGESPAEGLAIKLISLLETAEDLKNIKFKVHLLLEEWAKDRKKTLGNTLEDVEDLLDFLYESIKKRNEEGNVSR